MQEIIDKQGIVYKSIGVGKLEVVGYKGLDFYLEIPSRYKLQKVVSIGTYAFDQSSTLTTVTIPDTVENISGSVFVRCPNLECISVDAKNPKYRSLDGNLYNKNCTELIQYAVGKKNAEFTLPDTVDLIQIYAFWGNTNLKKILVGKKSGFISIDGNLYSEGGQMLLQYACGKTEEEFFIPNGITKIAHCCFSNCKSLKKVIIPNTV
ncbi:MAG: leucine-rich repeat protein, partial [Clostridia bacterium]|nr:leucine-rich repeat protein [Clostridia bacterium]